MPNPNLKNTTDTKYVTVTKKGVTSGAIIETLAGIDTMVKVESLYVSNTSGSEVTFDVSIERNGTAYSLANNIRCPVGGAVSVVDDYGLYLRNGDRVLLSATGTMDAVATWLIVDSAAIQYTRYGDPSLIVGPSTEIAVSNYSSTEMHFVSTEDLQNITHETLTAGSGTNIGTNTTDMIYDAERNLYIAFRRSSQLIQIIDRATKSIIGSYAAPGGTFGVPTSIDDAVYDPINKIIYAVDRDYNGLNVFDISDPTNINWLYTLGNNWAGMDTCYGAAIDRANNVVWFTSYIDNRLYAVDISNPALPTEITFQTLQYTKFVDFDPKAQRVLVYDDSNQGAGFTHNLRVYAVGADSRSLTPVGTPLNNIEPIASPYHHVYDYTTDYVYMVFKNRIEIIDVSTNSPVIVNSLTGLEDVAMEGGAEAGYGRMAFDPIRRFFVVYQLHASSGPNMWITFYDISSPTNPTVIARYQTGSESTTSAGQFNDVRCTNHPLKGVSQNYSAIVKVN